MKRMMFIAMCLAVVMAGCNGKKRQSAASVADTAQTGTVGETVADGAGTDADSLKHNADYIRQRLDSIYKYRDDARFCSYSYLKLDAEAAIYSKKLDCIYISGDHWLCGNDIDPKWRYKVKEVKNITASTALAVVVVHNYSDRTVFLDLVYERDDWFVDNFRSEFKDDDGSIRGYDEKAEIRNFIATCATQLIEGSYGKTFDIGKYYKAMESLGGVEYEEYALLDIDRDGRPEVCARSGDERYTAVFALIDGVPHLMVQSDGGRDFALCERGVVSQGSCGQGCVAGTFCFVENSRAAYVLECQEWLEAGESLNTLNGRNISEEEAQRIIQNAQWGEPVEIGLNWRPIA